MGIIGDIAKSNGFWIVSALNSDMFELKISKNLFEEFSKSSITVGEHYTPVNVNSFLYCILCVSSVYFIFTNSNLLLGARSLNLQQ